MIAGMMAIDGRFPLWENCLDSLLLYADGVVVRVEDVHLNDDDRYALHDKLSVYGSDIMAIHAAFEPWNRWNWREEMLRRLDDVAPELVLCPDQDEQFQPAVRDDLDRLRGSEYKALMFSYVSPMPTADGVDPCAGMPYPTYPGMPHMKAFMWREGLTYKDYTGFARISNYASPDNHMAADSQIMHYCAWTPDLRAGKEWKW